MGASTLSDLMLIHLESPCTADYNPDRDIQLWSTRSLRHRRPTTLDYQRDEVQGPHPVVQHLMPQVDATADHPAYPEPPHVEVDIDGDSYEFD